MKKISLTILLSLSIAFFTWFFLKKPVFKLDKIYLSISKKDFDELQNIRDKALEVGVLKRSKNDYVNCEIKKDSSILPGKVRLKGDWTDHLNGKKWSFRVKLEDSLSDGLKVFSLQNPKSRGYLNGYVFHRLLVKNGILSNEMSFVELFVNEESWGIYNLEEHLTERMIDHQQKPKGLILKFEDGEYFEKDVKKESTYGLLKTAKIKVYGDKSNKYKKNKAIEIIKEYQQQTDSVYTNFDAELMGKYYALCDLGKAYHAMGWINIRFYYNFKTMMMEPVGYDPYPALDWALPYLGQKAIAEQYKKKQFDIEKIVYSALYNQDIKAKYEAFIVQLTDSIYVAQFMAEELKKFQHFEVEIQREFKSYEYDWSFLSNNAKAIRNALITDGLLN
ncbi:hypothetical protein DNU06_12345 [Putridiphycobacter roseus]|uniref:Spore coat protein CotH n=1 Tax=Putridiphycobacter roseus TaxID=2219161 RepID=A0A2W1NPT1_9FLAO|nr:CotH kinase family protein [Putridiphycobacter roseus]PZE16638.1 hypothetical protein DNU06_12345 [Putridiphycobacter roseus]